MTQQTLFPLHLVAEDCASEGSAIWQSVQNYVITPHTAHSYSVPNRQPMSVSSYVNFTGHKSQGMTTELLNKGPALCLAPQLIKDSIDNRGEGNKLILEHYFLLCMLLHQCVIRSWCSEVDGTMFLQNIRNHSPSDTVSYPGTTESSVTLLWEPQQLQPQIYTEPGEPVWARSSALHRHSSFLETVAPSLPVHLWWPADLQLTACKTPAAVSVL